jgi:1A family penicillin-binding protein
MGRYTNLAATKPVKRATRKKPGRFAWFRNLSTKKKIAVIAAPILAFLILTPVLTYFIYARDITNQERLMNRNNTGIVLTDKDGKAFYSIGKAAHRNMVPLSEISDDMEHALLASEDKDFYKHGGFSIFSIFRAAFTRVGGGSTITQQLAKNTVLSDQRSFLRKYQELFVAIAIEQNYTKDQILEMYLNSVYYGENAFGIEEAAKAYFNKSPKDLTLAESAMLVGVLPAPSAYSPISGTMEYANKRQNTVLSRMVTTNYITEDQKTSAAAEQLTYGKGAKEVDSIAPHFAEMVITDLSKKYGYENVMRSGYQVKTSLDTAAQTALNESVAAGMAHINAMGGSNASGVIIDPKTGEIRALVGSADYENKEWGKVNMVTTARQPGSSFKPIYYAYAMADGVVNPATILHDKLTDFGGGYKPLNADKKFRGDISLRKSISQSLNIPSVEVMQKYGIDKSITAANNLGITDVKKGGDYGLALALGAAEAPLMQMTNAYAAFANQGTQYQPKTYTEVRDKFDKVIQSQSKTSKQAISKEGAYLISNILSDNQARAPIFGGSLTVPGHTVAVKTGTTNDSRDAWTIGYTPKYAVGVWVGNNNNEAMASGGSDMAGPIWRNTFNKLLAGQQNEAFPVPDGIVQRLVCSSNGGLASSAGSNTYNEYFRAGALPTVSCKAAVKVQACNLDTKQVEAVDEEQLSEGSYTRDLDKCSKKIQACDLQTGTVTTINESEYTSTKYSKDTTNCKKVGTETTKVTACNVNSGKEEQVSSPYDTTKYTTNYSMVNGKCVPNSTTQPTTPPPQQ